MRETEQWAIGLTVDAILVVCLLLLIRRWVRWRLYRKERAILRAFMIEHGSSKDDPRLKGN